MRPNHKVMSGWYSAPQTNITRSPWWAGCRRDRWWSTLGAASAHRLPAPQACAWGQKGSSASSPGHVRERREEGVQGLVIDCWRGWQQTAHDRQGFVLPSLVCCFSTTHLFLGRHALRRGVECSLLLDLISLLGRGKACVNNCYKGGRCHWGKVAVLLHHPRATQRPRRSSSDRGTAVKRSNRSSSSSAGHTPETANACSCSGEVAAKGGWKAQAQRWASVLWWVGGWILPTPPQQLP